MNNHIGGSFSMGSFLAWFEVISRNWALRIIHKKYFAYCLVPIIFGQKTGFKPILYGPPIKNIMKELFLKEELPELIDLVRLWSVR